MAPLVEASTQAYEERPPLMLAIVWQIGPLGRTAYPGNQALVKTPPSASRRCLCQGISQCITSISGNLVKKGVRPFQMFWKNVRQLHESLQLP